MKAFLSICFFGFFWTVYVGGYAWNYEITKWHWFSLEFPLYFVLLTILKLWLWSEAGALFARNNEKLKKTLEEYGSYIHRFTDPLLVRNFYAEYFEFIEIDSLDSVVPYESLFVNWEMIRADSEYLALLSDVMAQRIFQLSFYGRLKKEIQELLLVLNSEIEEIE